MNNLFKKIKRTGFVVALLITGAVLAGAQSESRSQGTSEEVKHVRSEKLPNVPGKTLTIATVNYAPGGKSIRHHHSGSVLAYVLTGAIRSENSATGAVGVYRAGESFFEPPGSEHLVSENASQTEPASLLAIFVANDGAQLTTHGDAQTTSAPPSTPTEFVDTLNFAFGKQTTQRATHAKGIVLLGKFTPSATAQTLSKAPHLRQAVPVTVRFSDNTGIPMLPDAAPLASPHGLAIKFHLPDGTETDLVTHSYNGFPALNADEMRQFFIAVGSSDAGAATPTPIEKYMATHPAAKAFLTTQDPPPVSYATLAYFGVNSFKFTNAADKITIGRYQIIPQAGKHFLPKEEIAKAAPGYLSDELRQRLATTPVRFDFRVQLAETGDKIEDPSIAWSDKNKTIDLGVLEITSIVPDSDAAERALLFMPGLLPAGIEPADPMIQFRNKTYPISYDRRHQ